MSKNLVQLQNSNENEINEKSEDVMVFETIEDTPFTAVYIKNDWVIVMGNEIASERRFEKIDELKEYIDSKPWELIVTSATIFDKIVKANKDTRNEESIR